MTLHPSEPVGVRAAARPLPLMVLPDRRAGQPDPALLEERYLEFLDAG